MNMKFRFYTIVMIMLAVTGMAWAQDDIDYEKAAEYEKKFRSAGKAINYVKVIVWSVNTERSTTCQENSF